MEALQSNQTYTYSPLPSGTDRIRLVRLLPPDASMPGVPRCHLEEFSLDYGPPFYALSYTWGPPENFSGVYDDKDIPDYLRDTQQYAISLNDKTFLVQKNLLDFLLELSRRAAHRQFVRYRHCLLWIDAICINQDDIQERNSQVSMMGDIYKVAEDVLVWLGSDNRGEMETVKKLIKQVANMANKIAQREEYAYDMDLIRKAFWSPHIDLNRILTEAGLPDLEQPEWWAFSVFFLREWFRRLWVFQEVAMARNITVMCGHIDFDWFEVYDCAIVLCLGLDRLIGRRWDVTVRNRKPSLGVDVRKIGILRSWCRSRDSPYYGGYHRYSLTGVSHGKDSAGIWAVLLLDFCHAAQTSEPVDKVYALVGIVRHLALNENDAVEVDYSLPESHVRTQIVSHIIRKTKWLNIIARVKQGPNTLEVNTPSWVPSFNISRVNSIFFRSSEFNASNSWLNDKLNPELPQYSIENRVELRTGGIHLGTICGLCGYTDAEPSEQVSYEKIARIIIHSPNIYPITGETKVRALWKSMAVWDPRMQNYKLSENEVQLSFKFSVLCAAAAHLQHVRVDENHESMLKVLQANLPYLQQLAISDSDHTIPTHEEIAEELSKWNIPVGKDIEDISDEKGFLHCKETFEKAGLFVGQYGKFEQGRRFFVTEEGHFGIGPEALSVGDEVWLIPRTTVPFVLRPANIDGKVKAGSNRTIAGGEGPVETPLDPDRSQSIREETDSYRVVGESYIHGVMYGEVIEKLDAEATESGVKWEWSHLTLL